MWLCTYSCANWSRRNEIKIKKERMGNDGKNRNNHFVNLGGLSVWHCQVLITGLQHVGMAWGAAYFWGALLMKCDSDPQQVWSTPQSKRSTLPSTWLAHWLGCWLAARRGSCQDLEKWGEIQILNENIQRKENKTKTNKHSFETRVGWLYRILRMYVA